MSIMVYALFALAFVIFTGTLLMAGLQIVNRLAEVNKQLMILVAGKEAKPEALRALVASNKPPQKNLPGIADKKKKEEKSKNTNYEMTIGLG